MNWARDFSKFDEVVHFAVFPSDKNMFSWMGVIIESYSGKKLQILVVGLPCGSKAGSQQLCPKFVVLSLACGPYQIYCITTYVCIHIYIYTYIYRDTCIRPSIHPSSIHPYIHACMHAYTHTHIITYILDKLYIDHVYSCVS